ncbi:MAG: sugar phosphate isomerase/epimerase family protein [Terriglobia bacterium]
MDLNRRDFIVRAALGMGAVAASGVPQLAANPYGLPVGLQLYTVRDHLEKDLEGTFKRVAEIGYKDVEIGGTSDFYGKKPAELKRMLDAVGLRPLSTHCEDEQLKSHLDKTIADARECGITYIGLASLDDQDRKSLDAIKRDADWFNHVGEAVNKAGAHFFYHGHNFDFASVGGVIEYDELIRHTDPKLANFQLDCFWCVRAGKDPVDYFNRFPGRFIQLHIKDLKPGFPPSTGGDDRPGAFTEVGRGVIDWPRIFKAARKGGMQHYYVEQDECDRDSLESARISYEYLHKLTV